LINWLINNGNGQDLWTDFIVLNVWTILAVVMSHVRLHNKIKKNHEETQNLLDPNTPGGLGELKDN